MIVVTIDLWRRGDPKQVVRLGKVLIANDGTSADPRRGSYTARVFGRKDRPLPGRNVVVSNFARQSRTVFTLLKIVLDAARY